MLSISRLDATDSESNFSKIDLVQNIESVLFVLEPSLTEKKITLTFKVEKDTFIIDGNYGQISQVFMNLISNAIKFSPRNTTIEISLERVVNPAGIPYILTKISDQGMGIPTEDIPQLFTRFFRARNVVAHQIPGTGLGLAIVEKIVLLHGGLINVASGLGVGTEFEIRLPEALSSTDALISLRRKAVLSRSISRVEASTLSDIAAVAHELGGAIGFYTFIEEGSRILEISRELGSKPVLIDHDYEAAKSEILTLLQGALNQVEKEDK